MKLEGRMHIFSHRSGVSLLKFQVNHRHYHIFFYIYTGLLHLWSLYLNYIPCHHSYGKSRQTPVQCYNPTSTTLNVNCQRNFFSAKLLHKITALYNISKLRKKKCEQYSLEMLQLLKNNSAFQVHRQDFFFKHIFLSMNPEVKVLHKNAVVNVF